MVDLTNIQNLVGVLAMLNVSDTGTVKKAEKALKPFLKHPTSALPLMQILRSTEDNAVRHQAALLLRRKIDKYFPKYTAQQQATLKTELVNYLLAETYGPIATAVAGIIALTAKAIYHHKQSWPEIFQLMLQLAQDPNEKHRILAFKLLGEVSN
jgi:hypothetical protein